MEEIVLACVYLAARVHGRSVELARLCELSELDFPPVERLIFILHRLLHLRIPLRSQRIERLAHEYANKLRLSESVLQYALKHLPCIEHILSKRSERVKASAALCYASSAQNENYPLIAFCRVADIGLQTLRRACSDIKRGKDGKN